MTTDSLVAKARGNWTWHRFVPLAAGVALAVGLATLSPVNAAVGDEQSYIGADGNPHECQQTGGEGQNPNVNSTDIETGQLEMTGRVRTPVAGEFTLELNDYISETNSFYSSNEFVERSYYQPPMEGWTNRANARSLLYTGYMYRRDENNRTGVMRYVVQISRHNASPLARTYFSNTATSANLDQVEIFRQNIVTMNTEAAWMAATGSAAVIAGFYLGLVADRDALPNRDILATSACIAAWLGVTGFFGKWRAWWTAANNALAAWDRMRVQARIKNGMRSQPRSGAVVRVSSSSR